MNKQVSPDHKDENCLKIHFFKEKIGKAPFFFLGANEYYEASKALFRLSTQGEEIDGKYLSPALVLCHFALELALKALISLKTTPKRVHGISDLLGDAIKHYSSLKKISDNQKQKSLCDEFSHRRSINLRYGEVRIKISPEEEDPEKAIQRLSEIMAEIFDILKNTWEVETLLKLNLDGKANEFSKEDVDQMEENLRKRFPPINNSQ